jgi:hypothetical protein
MVRRALHAELNAVRTLVADALTALDGKVDEPLLVVVDGARDRLREADRHLVAAAGGISPWAGVCLYAPAVFAAAAATAAGSRAIGLPAAWVIVTVVVATLLVLVALVALTGRIGARVNSRRLARAPGPAPGPGRARSVIDDGRLTAVPEPLSRARVRLVSAALRQVSPGDWRSPYLRHLAAGDRVIRQISIADVLLCQALDSLDAALDEESRWD